MIDFIERSTLGIDQTLQVKPDNLLVLNCEGSALSAEQVQLKREHELQGGTTAVRQHMGSASVQRVPVKVDNTAALAQQKTKANATPGTVVFDENGKCLGFNCG
ncbi:MAG: hypothetical protein Q7T96_18395 [Methylobacter sp.]|nr:hypothetical protein [Methylobacter sp.]